MAENEYTKQNRNKGVPSQIILDAGLNVFALQLLVESYTDLLNPESITFPFLGVNITLSLCKDENKQAQSSGHDDRCRCWAFPATDCNEFKGGKCLLRCR